MEEDFRAILLASSGVTAICGNRINWGAHPQGQPLPGVVLTVVCNQEGITLTAPDGLFQGRVQVDCYAPTYAASKILSRAVVAVMHGNTSRGFRLVTHEGTRDSRESGTNEAERPFRVSLDFLTYWRAS